ncbi:SGNH/GDSL hydrolase family protein [Tsukamurella sp. 8F]|uniref:SGNH/GDSL hydrolase family protein n=1 Tax=unclassified Tsukamurella TaxID=2633480 RepID=UPI0023B8A447|nr:MULTISPECIES: SGNH/GDSL hydrolase family protein [unclassified Tsukamurella]MDF0530179.1 SGNH/GDSL hydrolase family protein [Tsukamurella sp. 8J]MDF0586496.1 SGNH/GDSL hydrolase family protein [Tsukamurella sp. 8F]
MGYTRGRIVRDAARASVAAAGGAGMTWAAYSFLAEQAKQARTVIPHRTDKAPSRDGVYVPGQEAVERPSDHPADVRLMVFGDSTACGLGCDDAEQTPGVLIARGLTRETGRSVQLSTKAIVGATSRGLVGQIDAMLIAGRPPDVSVILVGANDVTAVNGIESSARRLGRCVRRLRGEGSAVVVGTCPDIGVVWAIPQPLRTVMRTYSLRLAARQKVHVNAAGGRAVPLELLADRFRAAPDIMLSGDHFHPSPVGYALAAEALLPEVVAAVGEQSEPVPGPEPAPPADLANEERPTARLSRALRGVLRRDEPAA